MGIPRMSKLMERTYSRFLNWSKLNNKGVKEIPSEEDKMLMFYAIEEATRDYEQAVHEAFRRARCHKKEHYKEP
jgi:hypothetical protein